MMTLYDREWASRRPVLEASLYLLRDFRERTASQICAGLPKFIDWASPALVMSVLASEGRRYVRRIGRLYKIKEYALDTEDSLFEREWKNRKAVMENALGILRDGQPRKARQIVIVRNRQRRSAGKRDISEVNSVLFSEGRRYVKYSKHSFEHRILP